MGKTEPGTGECYFQGLSFAAFSLSGAFWTVVLTYQLWLIVNRKRFIEWMTGPHIMCWLFPWLLALLPLTQMKYGDNDDGGRSVDETHQPPTTIVIAIFSLNFFCSWCVIEKKHSNSSRRDVLIWQFAIYYVWIILSILSMLGLLLSVYLRVRSSAMLPSTVRLSLKKLILYPLAWLVCQIPTIVSVLLLKHPNNDVNNIVLVSLGTVPAGMQPLFITIIFYSQNRFIRAKWMGLFRRQLCPGLPATCWSCLDLCSVCDMESVPRDNEDATAPGDDLNSGSVTDEVDFMTDEELQLRPSAIQMRTSAFSIISLSSLTTSTTKRSRGSQRTSQITEDLIARERGSGELEFGVRPSCS